jgi:hypothetical protein
LNDNVFQNVDQFSVAKYHSELGSDQLKKDPLIDEAKEEKTQHLIELPFVER